MNLLNRRVFFRTLISCLLFTQGVALFSQPQKGAVWVTVHSPESLEVPHAGSKIQGVTVTLSKEGFSRTFATGERGRVSFVGIMLGRYCVRSGYTGSFPFEYHFTLREGEQLEFRSVLKWDPSQPTCWEEPGKRGLLFSIPIQAKVLRQSFSQITLEKQGPYNPHSKNLKTVEFSEGALIGKYPGEYNFSGILTIAAG